MQDTEIELPPGLGETEISIFANARATDPQPVKLGVVLAAIQGGRLADKITKLRALLTRGDRDAYDAQKKKLSGVTLSGSFSVRNAQSLLKHSGLLQVDLDHLPNPEEVRDQLAADPHVAAAFLSPSAQGVKAVLRIPADPARHKESFLVADRYLRKTYGLVTDPSCKDVSRMMFVSHDPELRTNPNAVPLDVEGGTEPQPSFDSRRPATPQAFDLGELPTPESPEQSDAETAERLHSALQSLSAEDYEPWIRMGHALKGWNGPGAFDLWHSWSAGASTYKDPAECRNRWQGFRPDSGIDESAVFRAATDAGWSLPRDGTAPHRANAGGAGGPEGPQEWAAPIPLVREAEEPRPFPVNALGPIIGEAVREFQGFGKQPISMIGGSALAAASLACQGLADVARDARNTGPISLFVLIIAESGERKSSTDKAFSKALWAWQRQQADTMRDEIRCSQAEHSIWEAKRNGLLKAITSSKSGSLKKGQTLADLEAEVKSLESQEPPILREPRLFFEDMTAESWAWEAATGNPSFAFWSDEAGLAVGGQGMKDEAMMSFLAFMNRLWDGGDFHPSRKTALTAPVQGRRCTVNLMMQQTVFDKLRSAKEGMTRGLGSFARTLLSRPTSTMGTREYQSPPDSTPYLEAYHGRIRELMDLPMQLAPDGRLDPALLTLSGDAKTRWVDFFNKVESGLTHRGELSEVKDFASKSPEQAARIAGVLHVFENGASGKISANTMQRALRLAGWYLHEARRIFATSALPPEFKDAVLLLEWIRSRCEESQKSQESQASVLHEGPNQLRSKPRRDAALRVLEEHQWVILKTVNREKLILVNPAFFK